MGNGNDVFGGSWLFAFLIIALLVGGNGGGLFGNGNIDALHAAIDNQSTQQGLRDILLSSANNNYETANLIHNQTMGLMNQSNTNLINAIQGFNQLTLASANQFAELRQQMAQLGYQMESCCCSIKTQMLQDKYDELSEKYRTVQNDKSNADQSLYLLGVMGKWIANPAATAAA